ncbi:MAG TPA: carbohydrate ABC transporter permease [Mobilitalea sp.]|nr:carbohydrate ABC transporter permease [Mobilitalea sp.]
MFKSKIKRMLMPNKIAHLIWKIVRAVIITGLCFIILYPFFLKVVDSFKSVEDLIDPMVKFIPKHFTINNVKSIIQNMDYPKAVAVTALIAGIVGFLQMFTTSLIGYGFARFKFKGHRILFLMVIMTLIVPPQTIVIPMFMKFRFFLFGKVSLIDTIWPIIIMSVTGLGIKNGLYIFMLRQHFRNLPKELEEAAYIDGYNNLQTFFKIILPSSKTMLVTVFLLAFSWQWTDTLYSGLYLRNFPIMPNLMSTAAPIVSSPTMQLILNNSAAVLGILPLALVYFIGQNFFVKGVERSGIVG